MKLHIQYQTIYNHPDLKLEMIIDSEKQAPEPFDSIFDVHDDKVEIDWYSIKPHSTRHIQRLFECYSQALEFKSELIENIVKEKGKWERSLMTGTPENETIVI